MKLKDVVFEFETAVGDIKIGFEEEYVVAWGVGSRVLRWSRDPEGETADQRMTPNTARATTLAQIYVDAVSSTIGGGFTE